MTPEETREKAIQSITNMLRTTQFSLDFKVKKHPKGIHIIYEVSQEEMDSIINKMKEKYGNNKDRMV